MMPTFAYMEKKKLASYCQYCLEKGIVKAAEHQVYNYCDGLFLHLCEECHKKEHMQPIVCEIHPN
jgi:hypothetical protein